MVIRADALIAIRGAALEADGQNVAVGIMPDRFNALDSTRCMGGPSIKIDIDAAAIFAAEIVVIVGREWTFSLWQKHMACDRLQNCFRTIGIHNWRAVAAGTMCMSLAR